jgi:hypothetical protein
MADEELKPCPFCGGDGEKFTVFVHGSNVDTIGCRGCGVWFYTIYGWNRRPEGSVDVNLQPNNIASTKSCAYHEAYSPCVWGGAVGCPPNACQFTPRKTSCGG